MYAYKGGRSVTSLFLQLLQTGSVGFAEFAYGLVADLADTLALQVHVLSNLSHRLVLLIDAEESIDNLTLTLIERAQGILDGILNSLRMDTLVGKGRILIDEHGEQVHIGAMA